jgi:hypothetical protein
LPNRELWSKGAKAVPNDFASPTEWLLAVEPSKKSSQDQEKLKWFTSPGLPDGLLSNQNSKFG